MKRLTAAAAALLISVAAQAPNAAAAPRAGSKAYARLARQTARLVGKIDKRFQRAIKRAEAAHNGAAARRAAAAERRVLGPIQKAWDRAPDLGPGNPATCEDLCRRDADCLNGCYVLGGL